MECAPRARGLPPHEGGALGAGSGAAGAGRELTPQSEGFDPSERGVARREQGGFRFDPSDRGVAWRKALHTFLLISVDFQTQKEVRSCDSKVVQEGRGLPHGLIFWEEGCWMRKWVGDEK